MHHTKIQRLGLFEPNGKLNRTVNPQELQFQDVISLIESGYVNQHWDAPYSKRCHPCHINYDYIVKLETFDGDTNYIINNKLQGRGVAARKAERLATANAALTSEGRYLSTFGNISGSQMDFLFRRLDPDLQMFGYEFDRTGLRAKCRNPHSDNRSACC